MTKPFNVATLQFRPDPFRSERDTHPGAATLAHCLAQVKIVNETKNLMSQTFDISDWDENPRDSRQESIYSASRSIRHNGHACRLGLNHNVREALAVRREHKYIH